VIGMHGRLLPHTLSTRLSWGSAGSSKREPSWRGRDWHGDAMRCFCGKKPNDKSCTGTVESRPRTPALSPFGKAHPMGSWFVPPVVIPIVLLLLLGAYAALRASS